MAAPNVVNILQRGMDRLREDLEEMESLPVAYLCVKYGSGVFVEMLSQREIYIDNKGMVSLVKCGSHD